MGFSLPSGPLFRSLTGLPALALSPDEFRRAFTASLVLLWGLWGVAVFALRGMADPEARRRATMIVTAGGVAILLLVVVLVPPLLSSDLYRQAVYGRMVVYHGLNPYASPVNAVPGDPLFALANHQHLTTHYGPAYTLLSALVAAIAPSTVLGGAIAWKATAAAAALGCALLVGRVVRALGGAEADAQNARLWLAWNPLLVLEAAASGSHRADHDVARAGRDPALAAEAAGPRRRRPGHVDLDQVGHRSAGPVRAGLGGQARRAGAQAARLAAAGGRGGPGDRALSTRRSRAG